MSTRPSSAAAALELLSEDHYAGLPDPSSISIQDTDGTLGVGLLMERPEDVAPWVEALSLIPTEPYTSGDGQVHTSAYGTRYDVRWGVYHVSDPVPAEALR